MNELTQKARENLLSDEIGKFDLIESILPLPFLLSQKPRHIKKEICEKLQVSKDQIIYQSLISWINRLKKKHKKYSAKKATTANQVKDWRNFKPSEPVSSLQKDDDPVKRVTYP
jgi:hypothetical protein